MTNLLYGTSVLAASENPSKRKSLQKPGISPKSPINCGTDRLKAGLDNQCKN
jgi:hypothetical protein